MGSVFYDVQVPDYSARGLAMSGLLLTDEAARAEFSPQPDDQLPAGTLPAPATSRRTFGRNGILSAFAEVYDSGASRDARRIEVTTTLVGEDGNAAFSSRESLAGAVGRREELAHSSREADCAEGHSAGTLRAPRRSARCLAAAQIPSRVKRR